MLETFLKDTFNLVIHSTTEGQKSIDIIKTAKNVYDIIFMDINMPVMDGIQVIKHLDIL